MTKNFILFIFLYTTLFAEQESFPFIGVTVSTQTVDLQPIATEAPNKYNNPTSAKENTYGIQYGVQTKDYRTTFTYEGNSNFQTIDVEVDYILVDELFGTPKIRPYVGATLGYIMYNKDLITQYNDNRLQSDENLTAASKSDGYYGLDAGFLFYITDDIDLDIAYHYYFMNRLKPLDVMSGATFSLHYFY